MAGAKPRLFVGCASEAKPFVEHLCSVLADFCDVHPWWDSPAFKNMHSTLSDLLKATTFYDLGLFILSADDISISRGEVSHSVRDNVLFELGLFLGTLGPARTIGYMQRPEGAKLKVPSDLLGINLPGFTYKDHDSFVSATAKILPGIKRQINKEGLRHRFISLRNSWDFDSATHTFYFHTDPVKLHESLDILREQGLVLVIRKQDSKTSLDLDPAIVTGKVREISAHDTGSITIVAGKKGCLGKLRAEDVIQGYLLLVPKGVNISKMRNLDEMFKSGCRILDDVGQGVG
jgi:hypothetical protein